MVRDNHPSVAVELLEVSTKGDRDQRPFSVIGGKGIFTSEVESALIDGRADVAVHSAKDMTAAVAPGCTIVCVPPRGSVEDVVLGGQGSTGEARLGSLPPGSRVGTSSLRRRALLAEARPDLEAVELRGNIDTRLRKVQAGDVDAAILAAAGLERLGLLDAGAERLDAGWWVPAPSQGALAIEALEARVDVAELFHGMTDPIAEAEVACERAFALRLEGGCSVPLGCSARWDGSKLVVNGFLGLPDGSQNMRDRISGPLKDAVALGNELAEAIYAGGGDEILDILKDEQTPSISGLGT